MERFRLPPLDQDGAEKVAQFHGRGPPEIALNALEKTFNGVRADDIFVNVQPHIEAGLVAEATPAPAAAEAPARLAYLRSFSERNRTKLSTAFANADFRVYRILERNRAARMDSTLRRPSAVDFRQPSGEAGSILGGARLSSPVAGGDAILR